MAAVAPNDIWAVGGGGQTHTVHWDGAQWRVIPSPNVGTGYNTLSSVAAGAANDVWAVGSYRNGTRDATLILHWNGAQWSVVPSPNPYPAPESNRLEGVAAVAANDVWAVGESSLTHIILHWDGSAWRFVYVPIGVGNSRLVAVTALAANDVWAVGYSGRAYQEQTLTLHWNGVTWRMVPSPNPGLETSENELSTVAGNGPNDVWAAGWYDNGSFEATFTLHWDGVTWMLVPSPNAGSAPGSHNWLGSAAVMSADNAWMVGTYYPGSGEEMMILHWDGSTWSLVFGPSIGMDSGLGAVAAASSNDIWAIGDAFDGSQYRSLVLHYSSTLFGDVDTSNPFYPYIRCLACRGIVSGYSTSPPCATAPCFLPGANVTRGQMSKFIANAAAYSDPIPSPQQTFSDVPSTNPFWIYIERAAQHGVISGYTSSPLCTTGSPCFMPGNVVTRGQTAKFVSQAAGYSDAIPSTQQTFSDVPMSSPFWVYSERAYLHRVISGYTSSPPCAVAPCFLGGNAVTRGQTAKVLANAFYPACQTPLRR